MNKNVWVISTVIIVAVALLIIVARNNYINTSGITKTEIEYVKTAIGTEFLKEWQGVNDGCSLKKIGDIRKIEPDNYQTVIEYQCGLVPPGIPNKKKTVTVTESGKVNGI